MNIIAYILYSYQVKAEDIHIERYSLQDDRPIYDRTIYQGCGSGWVFVKITRIRPSKKKPDLDPSLENPPENLDPEPTPFKKPDPNLFQKPDPDLTTFHKPDPQPCYLLT